MKIIYHCYGGTHSSVTAASIHLGILPEGRTPTSEELLQLPLFDKQEADDHGRITFMGVDKIGNEIYVVGRRSHPEILVNIINGLADAFNIPRDSYHLINVLKHVNVSMKIGGTLSRQLRLISVGRPVVTWGTRRIYQKLRKVVLQVKRELGVPR